MLLILGTAVSAIIFLYSRNIPQQETATSPVAQYELHKTVESVATTKNKLSSSANPDKQKLGMTGDIEQVVNPEEDALSRIPEELKSIKQGVEVVSLDNMPIPEEYKEMTRKFKREMDAQGYAVVSENEATDIERHLSDEYKNRLKPVAELVKTSTFEFADLDGIPAFKEGKFLGADQNGAYVDGKWTGLTRLYKITGLGTVKLDESDFLTGKPGVQMDKDLVNADVNGHIASYTVGESASGKAFTNITWITKTKEYNLSVDQNAAKIDGLKDNLLDLAHSIPVE